MEGLLEMVQFYQCSKIAARAFLLHEITRIHAQFHIFIITIVDLASSLLPLGLGSAIQKRDEWRFESVCLTGRPSRHCHFLAVMGYSEKPDLWCVMYH